MGRRAWRDGDENLRPTLEVLDEPDGRSCTPAELRLDLVSMVVNVAYVHRMKAI